MFSVVPTEYRTQAKNVIRCTHFLRCILVSRFIHIIAHSFLPLFPAVYPALEDLSKVQYTLTAIVHTNMHVNGICLHLLLSALDLRVCI